MPQGLTSEHFQSKNELYINIVGIVSKETAAASVGN